MPGRSRIANPARGRGGKHVLLCTAWMAVFQGWVLAAAVPCILEEDWARVSLGGAPIGYVHTVTRRLDAPEGVIATSVFSETRVSRMGTPVSLRTAVEQQEAPDGALLSVTSHTMAGGAESRVTATVKGDRILIATETGGSTHSTELSWKGEILGPYAQTRLIRNADLREGLSLHFSTFLPELQRPTHTTLTIQAREDLEIQGKTQSLWRATTTQDALPNLPTTVWLDDRGDVVRSVTDVLGGIEVLRCTREEALQAVAGDRAPDLANRFFIPSDVTIRNPFRAKEALFRIEADPAVLDRLDLTDRRQTVEERAPGSVLVRVRALADAPEPAAKAPGPKYLASSPYLQCDDPVIVRLSRSATQGAETAYQKAKKLEEWVFQNITKKDLGVGFASAKEVAVSRQGDCTEHAVLLAAMLRAAGIPSRVAVGLLYWKGAFGYHMWTEAFLNDWTALDATLNEEVVDATHIKFTHSALDASSPGAPFLSLVQVVGQVKVSVEEVGY